MGLSTTAPSTNSTLSFSSSRNSANVRGRGHTHFTVSSHTFSSVIVVGICFSLIARCAWLWISLLYRPCGTLSMRSGAAQDERGVDAAEAEGVGEDDIEFGSAPDVGNVVQIAFRVGRGQVEGRGNPAVLHRQA